MQSCLRAWSCNVSGQRLSRNEIIVSLPKLSIYFHKLLKNQVLFTKLNRNMYHCWQLALKVVVFGLFCDLHALGAGPLNTFFAQSCFRRAELKNRINLGSTIIISEIMHNICVFWNNKGSKGLYVVVSRPSTPSVCVWHAIPNKQPSPTHLTPLPLTHLYPL